MNELRWYQLDSASSLRSAFALGYKSPILAMPTGTGKTHVFVYIATRIAARGKTVGIVVHRSYLIDQTSEKLKAMGVRHGVVRPGVLLNKEKIQVISVDTIIRKLHKFEKFDYLIFDEGHHVVKGNKWGKLIDYFNCYIMAFTATPCRTNGQGLGVKAGGYFDFLINGPQPLDLTPEFLSPIHYYKPPNQQVIDTSGLRKLGNDYRVDELDKMFNKKTIYGNVPDHYLELCKGMQGIAFCVSIQHTKNVSDIFNSKGIPATYITGKCPKKRREEVLAGFSKGRYKILCSCDLISEGFDVPGCSVAILLRLTKSLVLFKQQCGRVMRPAPGKDYCVILDHVGNYTEHGLPDEPIEWSLEGAPKKKKERSIVFCPKCFKGQYATRKCQYCGHLFGPGPNTKPVKKEIFVDESIKLELIKRSKQEKIKKITILKHQAKSLEDLYKVADEAGYKRAWARIVWGLRSRGKKTTIY